ncbi:MAG: hypothetical protein ACRDRJ_02720 [Streptosporangiaceae bacterium]
MSRSTLIRMIRAARALARRADADPAAELGRVSPDQRSDDLRQNPFGV